MPEVGQGDKGSVRLLLESKSEPVLLADRFLFFLSRLLSDGGVYLTAFTQIG